MVSCLRSWSGRKSLDIFKSLINDKTDLIISYIWNFESLIFTCISKISCEANACMQYFEFATAFIAVLLWQPCNPDFSVAINKRQSLIFLYLILNLYLHQHDCVILRAVQL